MLAPASYSSHRTVAGAPVSMPLVWDDIVPQLDARQSHLRDSLEPEASWAGDPRLPVLTETYVAAALGKLEAYANNAERTTSPAAAP